MTNCNSKGSCGSCGCSSKCKCCCAAHCDCVPKTTTKNCVGGIGPKGPAGPAGATGDDGHKFLCVDELICGLIGDICEADDGTEVDQLFLDENSGLMYQWTGSDWALLNSTTSPETPFYYKVVVSGGFNIYLVAGNCPFTITELCNSCPLGTKLLNCYTSEFYELGEECLWTVGCFIGGPVGPIGTETGPTGPDGEDFSGTVTQFVLGNDAYGDGILTITNNESPGSSFQLFLSLVIP